MTTAFRSPVLFLCTAILICSKMSVAAEPAADLAPKSDIGTTAQLFQPTKIWTVHLRFSAEQWAAMEPKATADWSKAFANGQRDAGTSVAAAGPLATAMLKRGDRNRDGKLDKDEFLSRRSTWFTKWDRAKLGVLDVEKLQAGLNLILDPEGIAQEGSFPDFPSRR